MNKLPELIVLSSTNKGNSFTLKNKVYTCGRSSNNDIHFNDTTISTNHCEIIRSNKGIYSITDKNSTNGTRVNSQYVTNVDLNNGDIIKLGNTELLYSCEEGKFKEQAIFDTKTKIDLTQIGNGVDIEEMENFSPFSKEESKFKKLIAKKATIYIFILLGILIVALLAWLLALV
ncbi:MAG TPA: FHA domain-containing protein [Victivallales bacterium]|nr:FHA domain-containing protein [Victivallales bacterium]